MNDSETTVAYALRSSSGRDDPGWHCNGGTVCDCLPDVGRVEYGQMIPPAALTPRVTAPECATGTQSAGMTQEAAGDQVSADAAQSSILRPPMRLNSRVLWVTRVASSASAWDAIHRSLAPMGVPLSLRRVACSA